MKTQVRPLDEDERAFADLAEVADWTQLAGPDVDQGGYAVVEAIVRRVSTATGWQPWPLEPGMVIDDTMAAWGFTTQRGTTMIASNGLVFADTPNSGWSAYEIGPDDIPAAEQGLDAAFVEALEVACKHWGDPAYVSDDGDPEFLNGWGPQTGANRRHLAVWVLPGAEFHLFSLKPTREPLSPAVGVSYAVYID